MSNALIGYTGFIGSNLKNKFDFDLLVNRENLTTLLNRNFDTIVCAGLPAEKWLANQNPDKDFLNTQKLMNSLESTNAKKFILISTVDVYDEPFGCNEDNQKVTQSPYGNNRYIFEDYIRSKFKNTTILRLPGVFGAGLKKNIIFDLIHKNQIERINRNNIYQWYPIDDLASHINLFADKKNIKLVNLCSEPLSVNELIDYCNLDFQLDNILHSPVSYDVKSKYAKIFKSHNDYFYSKEIILKKIDLFIKSYKL